MRIRKIISLFFLNVVLSLILYSYLHYSQLGELPKFSKDWFLFIYLILGANIIGFSMTFLSSLLNKIPVWQKKIGLRFILGLIINYLLILAIVYVSVLLYIKLTQLNYTISDLLVEYQEIAARVYILILILDILLVVSDFLIYSYKYYSQGQLKTARLSREQMELQFEALRTQLSPHYLFNSLNTISSLIYKDINQTEEYIRNLASTYKYILESDKKQLISLKKEIQFIHDYCYLLQIRFGKAFRVYIDIEKSYEKMFIPPISIQILVENAVKHNVFDDENPLEVDIIAKENSVYVNNKILKNPVSRESFKIGLGNIRKRYEVFTDKKIKITKNDFFKVELPLLKHDING
ncbi:MAG: histidine kinase [Bacteroidales bacterium]|nr:histidine kinase [Bacteroidales bacterium]